MKLYMDDERSHPEGWKRARNAREAKEILATGAVTFVSLDHDLYMDRHWDYSFVSEDPYESGEDVVRWMAENLIWPVDGLRIHTDYAKGRENMMAIVDEYGPYTKKDVDTKQYYHTEGLPILYT